MQATLPARHTASGELLFAASDLAVEDLAKSFEPTTPVFDDVSFSLASGEVVALLGKNGAGKSTLLRCLVRLAEPDRGRIGALGRDVGAASTAELRALRRSIGFVFQRHNLVPRASVLTNVVHGLLGRFGPKVWSQAVASRSARESAMVALERVGLAELAARRADRLSGGQSQRVAIARALVGDPQLVLADEAAASLDPSAGEEIMRLLIELARQSGVTVLFTTHNVEHALLADRALGLLGGRLAIDAPIAELDRARLETLYG